MKILHITPHLGGGVGTVIIDWMDKIRDRDHHVCCLDSMNNKAVRKLTSINQGYAWGMAGNPVALEMLIEGSDIVLVHYWDHPMLEELLFKRGAKIPDCRMVFWCHKNFQVPLNAMCYPDRFIDTSPIQAIAPFANPMMRGRYTNRESIWSTGNMDRFLAIQPKPHEGFNIGTVVSKKMDIPKTFGIFMEIAGKIPDAHFIWIGDAIPVNFMDFPDFNFVGKVDDVAPYLALMDVFAYPLRPDHYGTCEIALGEAMAAGVVPVVMNNPAERLIIEDAVNGFIGREESHFIDHFYYLKDNHQRFSLDCRKRARKLYSIDNMIASWDKVFNEMMRSPKTKRSPL